MHQQYDLPLQNVEFAPYNNNRDTFNHYLPNNFVDSQHEEELLWNLPKKYHQKNAKMEQNRPLRRRQNDKHLQSINQLAVTQISTCQDKQNGQRTIFNQFLEDMMLKDDFTEERVQLATFKPCQLMRQLASGRQHKEKQSRFKQILKENIFAKNRPQILAQRQKKKPFERKSCSSRQKTKYQKILDEIYNAKNRQNSQQKQKTTIVSVPFNKIQHKQQKQSLKRSQKFEKQKQTKQRHLRLQSQPKESNKIIRIGQFIQRGNFQSTKSKSKQLQKTFDTKRIKTQQNTSGRETQRLSQRWMEMTFDQRQRKTLQNKKQKQNKGQKIRIELETKGCTFKPTLTEFKPQPIQKTFDSYAKMYLDKIKRRY